MRRPVCINQPADNTLGVASWNAMHLNGPEEATAKLRASLFDGRINLLGLQGVWGTLSLEGDFQLPRTIRHMAQYAIRHPEDTLGWQADGVVLLSGLAIRHMEPVVLSYTMRYGREFSEIVTSRVCQRTELDWDGASLTVLHPHLSTIGVSAVQRAQEHEALLEVVDSVQGSTVLLGNLNVGRGSKLVKSLQERMVHIGAKDKFWTWRPQWLEKLGMGKLFGRKLDYIFATPDLEVVEHGVHEVEGVDHRPVWARLKRTSKSACNSG